MPQPGIQLRTELLEQTAGKGINVYTTANLPLAYPD